MEIEQYRKSAFEIIHEYYYVLPNNGYLTHGLCSCDRRYKEAIQCAIIGVKRLILTLEFMSTESNDPAIMDRINFYDKVQDELYKMQADDNKVEVNEYEISEDEAVAYFEQAEKMNKAREYSSPVLEELINETTPEELEKINKEMEAMNNKQQTASDWFTEQISSKNLLGIYTYDEMVMFDDLLNQFKEMEKEQTLDFTRNAVRKILNDDIQNPFNLEQYYNETYGGNK
jgi:hypothetical protein